MLVCASAFMTSMMIRSSFALLMVCKQTTFKSKYCASAEPFSFQLGTLVLSSVALMR